MACLKAKKTRGLGDSEPVEEDLSEADDELV
jgi:hypothetical protein